MSGCGIVPDFLLARMAVSGDEPAEQAARHSLVLDARHRGKRLLEPAPTLLAAKSAGRSRAIEAGPGTGPDRVVADAGGTEDLPGDTVRSEGDEATGDVAADEAYDGLGATWTYFSDVHGRDSIDGAGMRLLASVHYSQQYANAFWDGTQMVFGDGDGEFFGRMTASVDVIGHELAHGVTEATAGLEYQGQSGALNESMSDVFGSLVKQLLLGQTADEADWLIGAGLFTDKVQGVALRSMSAPGTAFDDPVIGTDPQPATMADFVETLEDNGGVHINSGIPNKAFHLAATGIGGNAWEGAGLVWYAVLTSGDVARDCDFATFAALTVAEAVDRFGEESAEAAAVADAWSQVGLPVPGAAPAPDEVPADEVPADEVPADEVPAGEVPADEVPTDEADAEDGGYRVPVEQREDLPAEAPDGGGPAKRVVRVVRTGGIAGMRIARDVPVDDLDDDDAAAWQGLLTSPRLAQIAAPTAEAPPSGADRFTYTITEPVTGIDLTAADSQLPADVRGLLERSLGRDRPV